MAGRKKSLLNEEPRMPKLTMLKIEAERLIDEQINKAEALLKIRVNSWDELKAARQKYYKWLEFNTTLLKRMFNTSEIADGYSAFYGAASPGDLRFEIQDYYDGVKGKVSDLESIKEQLTLYDEPNAEVTGELQTQARRNTMPANTKKVFVIHGRNGKIRDSMFSFLRAIGLNPIEWSQAVHSTGNAAPSIMQVLEVAFGEAQAVIALFTGDDEAKLKDQYIKSYDPDHERNLTPQARPNVLFEAGMAFGSHPTRTIIVEIGVLRPFTDIAGLHTVRLDNSARQRKAIAQRLQTAACDVDLSGEDWLEAGDFNVQNP